ncbi:UDP-N-acetylmuramoyl-tripeptide--D-alanyl-D-alanine ligase [Microbacterium deminutum]|uniref:UDP-N-acetylmuramoyl-tripeptide--D-alanyl-D-alanine ligase n=1 Tax=Microbacterium deminutum TaxID=344164 RepID=A0ABP5BR91_9MICO
MITLTLSELARAVGGEVLLAPGDTLDTVVSGAVDTDSRLIGPGSIFVAKPGEQTDGHLFVDAAAAAGAVVAIVEHPVESSVASAASAAAEPRSVLTQIVVRDAVEALADLAREVVARVRSGGDLRIVGITGSNGKTTTKNLLARILEPEGETVSPKASFNNEVGAPLTMLRVTEATRYLVSEFGASAPGEIARLAGLVEPDVGVVLMVGMAHAGGFGGIEATLAAKSELVRALHRGGLAVLNADDARVASMAPIASERDAAVRWFGRGGGVDGRGVDVRADDVEVSASGTTCVVTADGVSATLRLRVLGEHHVMNALAAIATATALGVSLADCIERLEAVEIAERWRMQPLGSERVRIINDAYNASPDSMAAALRTLAQITGPGERTVAVLGAMSELGEYAEDEHDRVGLLAVRLGIQRIVVVGAGARRMFLEAVAQGSWDGEAIYFETADEAYDYLMTELRDGDRVLVKSSNSAGLRFLGDRLGESFS